MERPGRLLLLSELRVRSAAYDVSLSRCLLTWKRRVSGPVYHPFRPSKTQMSPSPRSFILFFLHRLLCLSASNAPRPHILLENKGQGGRTCWTRRRSLGPEKIQS